MFFSPTSFKGKYQTINVSVTFIVNKWNRKTVQYLKTHPVINILSIVYFVRGKNVMSPYTAYLKVDLYNIYSRNTCLGEMESYLYKKTTYKSKSKKRILFTFPYFWKEIHWKILFFQWFPKCLWCRNISR